MEKQRDTKMNSIYESYWTKLGQAEILPDMNNKANLEFIGDSLENYILLKEVGHGANGTVFKAQSKKNNGIYALKKINLKHIQKQRRKDIIQEVSILKSLKHKNILECYGSFASNEDLYIVTEFAEYGDLSRLIKKLREKRRKIGEREIWDIIWQISLALLHLHAHRILHRDIKCLNILLTKDRTVKLGDLGESVLFNKSKLTKSIFLEILYVFIIVVGTPLYLPPEVIKGEGYDLRADIWGFGCVLYELIMLTPPFIGQSCEDVFQNIVSKDIKFTAWYFI